MVPKSASLLSVSDFLVKVAVILNLSAPGAASLENPFALSYRSLYSGEAVTTSSLI